MQEKIKEVTLVEKLNILFLESATNMPVIDIFIEGKYNSYKIQKLHNYFTSAYVWFSVVTKEINGLKEIESRDQFVNLINNVSIIKEGISKLSEIINHSFKSITSDKIIFKEKNERLFYSEWSFFWKKILKPDEFTKEVEEILSSDDEFFKYLRALVVHPFEVSHHPKAKDNKNNLFFLYLKEQSVQLLDFYKFENDGEQIIKITINKIKETEEEINDNYLYISTSLNKIKRYARNQHIKLLQIIKWLINFNKHIINELNHKYEWDNDNLTFLNQYINVMEEKFLDTHFFKIFRDKYLFFVSNKLISEENGFSIREYFNTCFSLLRKNIGKLEYYNYKKFHNLYELIDVTKNILDLKKYIPNLNISAYDVEKINLYLKGERKGLMPAYEPYDENVTNEEIFLSKINIFYKQIGHKFVSMNIEDPNLTFLEIRLLLDVALYKLSTSCE